MDKFSDTKGVTIPVLIALLAIGIVTFWKWSQKVKDPLRVLARPTTTLPVLGNIMDIMAHQADLYDWMVQMTEELRCKPWRMDIPGGIKFVVFSSPEATEHILKTEFESFAKGDLTRETMGELLGGGIFNSDGERWLRQRKMGSRIFTHNNMKNVIYEQISAHTRILCSILSKNASTSPNEATKRLDLASLLSNFTMDTFTKIVFGYDMQCMQSITPPPFQAAFDRASLNINTRFLTPKWSWQFLRQFNIGVEKQFANDIATMNEIVYKILDQTVQDINNTKQDPANHAPISPSNLIAMFLDSSSTKYGTSDNDSTTVDDDAQTIQNLRDMVMNFLLAGRDSTAQTLCWLFLNFFKNPHVLAKLREEITIQVPQLMSRETDVISMQDVNKLEYLDACLKENLRLHPAVAINSKECVKETVFPDGTKLVPGEWACFSGYIQGRMTNAWGPNAKEFVPERWLEIDPNINERNHISPFKYSAFHAGPRMCLGMNLAMLEMKIVVTAIVSKFNFIIEKPQEINYARAITLPMDRPMYVTISPN